MTQRHFWRISLELHLNKSNSQLNQSNQSNHSFYNSIKWEQKTQLCMRWPKLNVRVEINLEVPMVVKISTNQWPMDHHLVNGKIGISSISNGKSNYLIHNSQCLKCLLISINQCLMDHHLLLVKHTMMVKTTSFGNNGRTNIMITPKICSTDLMVVSAMEDKAWKSIDAKSSKTVIRSLKEELETLSLPKLSWRTTLTGHTRLESNWPAWLKTSMKMSRCKCRKSRPWPNSL